MFLTIGGGTKFIPLTGVTLPLISYGGSSVLTTMIMFSIMEGLYMIKEDEIVKRPKKKRRERKDEIEDLDYSPKHDRYRDEMEEEYYDSGR